VARLTDAFGTPLCEEVAFVVGFQGFGHDKLRMFFVLVMGASQKLAPPLPGYILGIGQCRMAEDQGQCEIGIKGVNRPVRALPFHNANPSVSGDAPVLFAQ